METQKKSSNPLIIILVLSLVFFVLFAVTTATVFFSKGGSSSGSSKAGLFSGGSIGIFEINGVIMDSKKALKRFDKFNEDSEVKAIVVRINSPGGSVAPSQEIYEALKKAKKPVVASMSSVAASGGYYIAMGAQKVFANPGTITGSIGVIMEFANLEKLYEWAKVKRFSLKTGRFKDAGADYRTMEPEERALLQGMIDDVLGQFKKAVAEGRKLSMDAVTKIADGRIFSGSQAKANKLVDELGTLQDAIDEAAKLAKIKGKPHIIYPEKNRNRFLDAIMQDPQNDEDAESESTLESLAKSWLKVENKVLGRAPGIYWLWTGSL
ncbi:MAG: signal peptide peptidase SppA [Bdellovibrionales bacterium]|nr:signal peptide peptidase SppA [Bdellovibrionales bacterium]